MPLAPFVRPLVWPLVSDGDGSSAPAGTSVPYERLHSDGSLWARGQLLDGEQHGFFEWFRLDGTLMRSGGFDRGRQVGVWTTYDKQGAPHKETRFAD